MWAIGMRYVNVRPTRKDLPVVIVGAGVGEVIVDAAGIAGADNLSGAEVKF